MRWLRTHVPILAAVVGTLSAVVGVVAVLVPNTSGWLTEHPLLGWLAAFISLSIALWVWAYLTRRSGDVETENRRLIMERDAAQDRLDSLLNARTASDRDLELFKAVLFLLPWHPMAVQVKGFDDRTIPWLTAVFNAKSWAAEDFDRLSNFVTQTAEQYFDDEVVEAVFQSLRSRIWDLVDWMSLEGGPVKGVEGRYALLDETRYPGGVDAYFATRRRATKMVEEIINARREFERVGRKRGL